MGGRVATSTPRADKPFKVISEFKPAGDQPTAIAELTERVERGDRDIVLLGATGTGKSATVAWLIEQVQRPTLVLAPNKTLAAQLANEFRELMPENAVEYSSLITTIINQKLMFHKRIPSLRKMHP